MIANQHVRLSTAKLHVTIAIYKIEHNHTYAIVLLLSFPRSILHGAVDVAPIYGVSLLSVHPAKPPSIYIANNEALDQMLN